jgi:hypothetical protein
MSSYGFGVNASGGAQPANHYVRFDPINDGAGYIFSIRKMRIEVKLTN